ncbi:MAG: hypothetical protein QOK44_1512, partial [Betaproteobacteria bacterium]|nr:hypothetical protein [Betaproteobacteria bacterium]
KIERTVWRHRTTGIRMAHDETAYQLDRNRDRQKGVQQPNRPAIRRFRSFRRAGCDRRHQAGARCRPSTRRFSDHDVHHPCIRACCLGHTLLARLPRANLCHIRGARFVCRRDTHKSPMVVRSMHEAVHSKPAVARSKPTGRNDQPLVRRRPVRGKRHWALLAREPMQHRLMKQVTLRCKQWAICIS